MKNQHFCLKRYHENINKYVDVENALTGGNVLMGRKLGSSVCSLIPEDRKKKVIKKFSPEALSLAC